MDPVAKRKWPRSGLETTVMGFGAAPIGNIFRPISEEDSASLIKAAWDAGVRYFDTAYESAITAIAVPDCEIH